MLRNLRRLFRYRGLIQSLVARELKARYRGSVLGFLWSFINPLLLLLIYTFVFTVIMPNRNELAQPYAVFMFCGILPWNWFSSSLMEASGSLVAGGNLIVGRGIAQLDDLVVTDRQHDPATIGVRRPRQRDEFA